ncbi:hypothetical protein C7408_101155 [Paraburkholderia caballeronis]|nr:hypothetical protein C7406_108155 [Paraburkholderia caballeronis]TDV20644.1 hypothetical protein C7408_101155 [Paraburkholderia caballeronis]TDV33112.1 hypothetical protein C7404_101251 [Paraburkholderia caballeronis]
MRKDQAERLARLREQLTQQAAAIEESPAVRRVLDRSGKHGRVGSWREEVASTRDLVVRMSRVAPPMARRPRQVAANNRGLVDHGFSRVTAGLWIGACGAAVQRIDRGWWSWAYDGADSNGPYRTALAAAEALVRLEREA